MAEELEVGEEQLEAEAPTRQADRRGLLRLVKAAAFVSVIVVVEIVIAAMLAPSAQDTVRLAHEFVAATEGQTTEDGGRYYRDKRPMREVEMGIYNVTRYNPVTNTTLAIDFELYGTVLAEDVGRFQSRFENNKARIREQVTMTLHGAESADLTDPGLGLIKRQILEKTNRALGEPLLKEILFSRFNFVER